MHDPSITEISFAEARGRLGVHSATLEQWVTSGRIQARRTTDGRLVFLLREVERLRRESGPVG
jgi:predicted site-specific integrase-resolvase